jgi:hypothetical protein
MHELLGWGNSRYYSLVMSTAPAISVWTRIHQHLEDEMRRVREEIRTYPAPIPACDAQYNFLLEKREALTSELYRLRELMTGEDSSQDPSSSVDEFLNMTTHLDDAAKRAIRAFVDNE